MVFIPPFGSPPGGGQTLYEAVVDAAGDGDYTTIEAAFNDGKTRVFVRAGTYNPASDIDIPDGGKLTGESRDGVVLDFQDAVGININVATGNNDITVENLTIQNCQPGTTVGAINFVNTDRSILHPHYFSFINSSLSLVISIISLNIRI